MNIMKSTLAVFMLLTLFLVVGCDKDKPSNHAAPPADKAPITEKKDAAKKDSAAKTVEEFSIKVYYPDDKGMKLVGETRTLKPKEDKYKEAVQSLLSGTKTNGVTTIIPAKTKLNNIEVNNGVATVDFSEDLVKNFIGGSTGEEMLVGSIVNTLTEFSEVKSVQILLDGKKVNSLAGHIDAPVPIKRMTELLQ